MLRKYIYLNKTEPRFGLKLQKGDCQYFSTYERIVSHKGRKEREIITGLVFPDNPDYIHEYVLFNFFALEPVLIPPSFKKTTLETDPSFYCDTSKILLKPDNTEYSKISKKFKDYSSYFIHDNGDRPYLVYVSPDPRLSRLQRSLEREPRYGLTNSEKFVSPERREKTVYLYKRDDKYFTFYDTSQNWEYIVKAKSFTNVEKVFIGHSYLNRMTEYSGGYGKEFDGNSILLHIKLNEYTFIGRRIFSFKTPYPIIHFESPVGNNDVPYPIAVDSANRFYLFAFNVILTNVPASFAPYGTSLGTLKGSEREPRYRLTNSLEFVSPERRGSEQNAVKERTDANDYYLDLIDTMGEVLGITEFKIDGERYRFNYSPPPDTRPWMKNMSIVKDGKLRKISFSEYRDLNDEFAKIVGIIPLSEYEI